MADPDLQIRGGQGAGGGSHPGPEIRGAQFPKIFFRPFRPHFRLKIRVGAGPSGPSPGSATANVMKENR